MEGQGHFLNEMRDAVGLAMLKLGKDPAQATEADADTAVAEMQKAVDAGIVRAFTGNDYAEDLVAGNVVLAMAWSGDIVRQAGREGDARLAPARPRAGCSGPTTCSSRRARPTSTPRS